VVPVVVVVVEATLLVAGLELTEGTSVIPLDVRTIFLLDVKWLLSADVVLVAFATSWLLMLVVFASNCVVVLVIVVTKVCVVVFVAVSVVVVCVDISQSHHCISLPSCLQQPRDLQWAAVIACLSCGRIWIQRRLLSLYVGQPGPDDLILI